LLNFLESEIKMGLRSRRFAVSFVSLLIVNFTLSAQLKQDAPPAMPIFGFSAAHAASEHELETTFQSIPTPDKAREWHRTLTAEPHPAASERNNQLADFVADEWRK
jgi:N-acetylated-alpha-linked acidic dipeptidase